MSILFSQATGGGGNPVVTSIFTQNDTRPANGRAPNGTRPISMSGTGWVTVLDIAGKGCLNFAGSICGNAYGVTGVYGINVWIDGVKIAEASGNSVNSQSDPGYAATCIDVVGSSWGDATGANGASFEPIYFKNHLTVQLYRNTTSIGPTACVNYEVHQ